jgi:hypothetical protein
MMIRVGGGMSDPVPIWVVCSPWVQCVARGFSPLRTGLGLLPFAGPVRARVCVTNRVCPALCREGILGLFRDIPVGSPLPGLLLRLCSALWRQMMRGAGDLRKFPQARQAAGHGPVGWPRS